jgi:hypothetical protein
MTKLPDCTWCGQMHEECVCTLESLKSDLCVMENKLTCLENENNSQYVKELINKIKHEIELRA